jgi:hypothetical protein
MSIQIVGPVTIFIIVRIDPTIAIYKCTAIYWKIIASIIMTYITSWVILRFTITLFVIVQFITLLWSINLNIANRLSDSFLCEIVIRGMYLFHNVQVFRKFFSTKFV